VASKQGARGFPLVATSQASR